MNRSDRYRLVALLEIAGVYPEALAIAEVARRRGVPAAYLAQLLRDLRRDGWIVSRRGPGGGVALGCDPAEMPVAAVLAASPTRSGSPGAIDRLEESLAAALKRVLGGLTLADLVTWDHELRPVDEYQI